MLLAYGIGRIRVGGTRKRGTIRRAEALNEQPPFRSEHFAMNMASLLRYASIAAVTLVTGCTGGANVSNAPLPGAMRTDGSVRSPRSTGFRILYRFSTTQAHVGILPRGSLVYNNGYVWGTTQLGGGGCFCGTVFAVPVSGTTTPESVGFDGTNGKHPWGGLTADSGKFYGTTEYGGTADKGTYFDINPATGQITVLESFSGPPSMSIPQGRVLFVSHEKYMVSAYGGSQERGALYNAAFGILSSFDVTDGLRPRGDLGSLDFDYTSGGRTRRYAGVFGAATEGGRLGGTVFMAPYRTDRHTEPQRLRYIAYLDSSGYAPMAGVTTVAPSTVIVTTTKGGSGQCQDGCGAVIVLSPPFNCGGGPFNCSWERHALYAFQGGADGARPSDAVIAVNGKLYGTTASGGSGPCTGGCGTIYELDPSTGTERVLHSFDGADGATPLSDLLYQNGELYGTTALGGGGACISTFQGCGTVFALHL